MIWRPFVGECSSAANKAKLGQSINAGLLAVFVFSSMSLPPRFRVTCFPVYIHRRDVQALAERQNNYLALVAPLLV
jgi:hypothetical protein